MENMEIGEDQPWDGIYGMEIQILRWPETPFPSRALRSWGTEATAKGARRWALEYSATAKGYLPWGEKVLATPCYLRVPLMLRPHRFFRALWCDDAKVSTKQGEAKVARPTTGSSGNDHPNMTGFRLSFYGETKAVLRLEKKRKKHIPLSSSAKLLPLLHPDISRFKSQRPILLIMLIQVIRWGVKVMAAGAKMKTNWNKVKCNGIFSGSVHECPWSCAQILCM